MRALLGTRGSNGARAMSDAAITTPEGLEAVVGKTPGPVNLKVIDHLDDHARRWIANSPLLFGGFDNGSGTSPVPHPAIAIASSFRCLAWMIPNSWNRDQLSADFSSSRQSARRYA